MAVFMLLVGLQEAHREDNPGITRHQHTPLTPACGPSLLCLLITKLTLGRGIV